MRRLCVYHGHAHHLYQYRQGHGVNIGPPRSIPRAVAWGDVWGDAWAPASWASSIAQTRPPTLAPTPLPCSWDHQSWTRASLRVLGGGLDWTRLDLWRFRHEFGLRSGILGGQAPALCMQVKPVSANASHLHSWACGRCNFIKPHQSQHVGAKQISTTSCGCTCTVIATMSGKYLNLFNFSAAPLIHAGSLPWCYLMFPVVGLCACQSPVRSANVAVPVVTQCLAALLPLGLDLFVEPGLAACSRSGCRASRDTYQTLEPDGPQPPLSHPERRRTGEAMLGRGEPEMPRRLRIPDNVCDI
jgi:hypothetical protein